MLGGFLAGMSNSNVQVEGIHEAVLTEEQTAFFESCEGIECKDDAEFAVPRMMMENNENFYNLAMAITADEIQHYVSTNEEVIYEGGKLKSIFETIKKAIKKAWEKVKGFFKKVFATISGWITTDKKLIEKYGDTIKKFKGEIEVSSFTFTHLYEKPEDLRELAPALDFKTLAKKSDDDNYFEKQCDILRGKSIGKDSIKTDDFNTELKKYFRNGQSEKSSIKFTKNDADTLIKEVEKCDASKKAAQASYDACEKFFKKLIADANDAEKTAEAVAKDGKFSYSDYDKYEGYDEPTDKRRKYEGNGKSVTGGAKTGKTENVSKAVGLYTRICRQAITISHQIMQQHVSAINQAHSEARTIILKMAAKANKDGDGKAKNESAELGLEGFQLI